MKMHLVVLVAAATTVSCGGGGGDGGGDAFGLQSRQAPALAFPTGAAFETAYGGVTFDGPLVVTAAPGDTTHLYVATQGGTIFVFDRDDNVTAKRVFLDLTDRTRANGEQGLLGLAFDPAYASNGRVYVYYSQNHAPDTDTGDEVIARYTADVSPQAADRTTEKRLLQFAHPDFNNHNGGGLAFGPDGMLYASVGDGGSGGDPDNHAQNLGLLLGKILRIAPDGSIPPGNPFVGTPGARGEIWAFGLRNPFRFSFDPPTGRLWAGDVGQDRFEEVDLVTKGGNYGWRKFEGNHVFEASDPTPANTIAPVTEYGHDVGNSITGGVVYRGSRFPALTGRYLFGDFGSGRIWSLEESGGTAVSTTMLGTVSNPSSFGLDVDGEPLITSYSGSLFRLANDSDDEGELPPTLSATGLFRDTASLTPADGVVEYTVNAAFWSDGALKRRWIAVPGTGSNATDRVGFDPTMPWTFPRGTVLVKEFEIDLADGTRKRLETRVLVNGTGGWRGYTYRWNDAGTDATLLTDRQTVQLTVADRSAPSGSRTQTYEFPDRATCLECHTGVAGGVLGVHTQQLNTAFAYPGGVTDNQLRALAHAGYFSGPIPAPSALTALPDPADATADLSARARAYLDVNCSQCHRPGGPTPVDMDLRFETAAADRATDDLPPTGSSFGIANARRIAPGDHARSLVWARMSTTSADERMPPVATHVVDAAGSDLIAQWIDAGAP